MTLEERRKTLIDEGFEQHENPHDSVVEFWSYQFVNIYLNPDGSIQFVNFDIFPETFVVEER